MLTAGVARCSSVPRRFVATSTVPTGSSALVMLVARVFSAPPGEPADVDLDAAPPEGPPQEGPDQADRLDAFDRDGLGDGRQKAAP